MSLGSLVFRRDMLLPIPVVADIECICNCRQTLTDCNAVAENLRHTFYDYNIGDQICIAEI